MVWFGRSMLPLAFVSDWTFVRDFGWDVRASFVFDVDDAWLQYHFPMTCGQRKCSFCVTMTQAFARYNVGSKIPLAIRHNHLTW